MDNATLVNLILESPQFPSKVDIIAASHSDGRKGGTAAATLWFWVDTGFIHNFLDLDAAVSLCRDILAATQYSKILRSPTPSCRTRRQQSVPY